MKRLVFFLSLFILCSNCNTPAVDEQTLLSFISDGNNHLSHTTEHNGVSITVSYYPSDLLFARELKTNESIDREQLKAHYDSLVFFTLRLSRENQEIENFFSNDPAKFAQLQSHLAGQIKNGILLIADKDTINVLDVIYVRSYGMSPSTTLLAAFNEPTEETQKFTFLYEDQFLRINKQSFEFENTAIQKIPTLKNL